MKLLRRLLPVLFLLCLALSLPAQNQPLTVINGRVNSAAGMDVRLLYKKVPFINQPLEMKTKTDSAGKFTLIFPIERRTSLELVTGNNSITLMISPGDTFFMDVKLTDTMGIYHFTGTAAQESYLNYLNYQSFESKKLPGLQDLIKTAGQEEYKKTIDTWMKEYQKINADNLKKIKATKQLKEHAAEVLKIKEATYHLIYINYQRNQVNQNYLISPEVYKIITNPALIRFDYVASPEYQNFLTLHLTQVGPFNPGNNPCGGMVNYARYTDTTYPKQSHDFLMARILAEGIESGCYRDLKPYYEAYTSNSVYPEFVQFLKTKVSDELSLEPGNPAPDFKFVDINGNTHSLADLKGKVIYLDFWATWCGPCIRAMRSAEPLKARLKENTNIAFVYISTDQDQQKWKAHSITNNGEPNHWHMGSSIMEASMAYKIQTIPRYVIIDKEGNIVNSNAPRPDDPNLEALLLRLAAE